MARSSPLDVLIVDDEAYTLEMMQVLIEALGHRVHTAADGAEALRWLLEERRPMDVVLMDVLMPGVDGLEAVRRLRADARTRELPIVCVSAKANGDVQAAGLAAGCDRYLIKPVPEDRIFAAITEALTSRGRLAPGASFD